MRPRDLTRFEGTLYDLLVVGGGIHGLACAYEAASRGLRVALVEAADFGGGATFNHQKTAHGGLRSLATGHLGRARESIRERRALARIAPWFLRPLPFLVGTYRSVVKNRVALRGAFKVDAWLGRRRNDGVEPELHLPAPRLVSKAATLRLFPGIHQPGLTGGAQWYDYQIVEADRLTLAFAAAADRSRADLANYVEATDVVREHGRITGMMVRDRLTRRTFEVKAHLTLNATGSRAGDMMRLFGVDRAFPLLKAMNLVTSRRASDMALAAPGPDGRMLTLVPWRGRALIGTSQSTTLARSTDVGVSSHEIEAFIKDANVAFPALKLSAADVTLVHRGIVPASLRDGGRPDLKPDAEIIDHANGAMTAIGVKFTTARAVAERAIAVAARRLGRRLPPSRTATTPLPGAAIADHEALAIETARDLRIEVPLPMIRHLIALYAEGAAEIVRLVHERPELRQPLCAGCETIQAEVVYTMRREMAVRLSDILIRRTGLGSASEPPADAARNAARIAQQELGWDAERTTEEISDISRFYAID
ncbi:MAG: FAD-dependent oxidoreductase [Vicinamibacterales bacterium]